MKLCLNTDCLADLTLAEAVDFAASLPLDTLEIAAGGHSQAPHMRIDELLANAAERARFVETIASRGLTLNAINCSADPLHPIEGAAHLKLIRDSIRLAGELGVDKIVTMSGCPGDGSHARTVNWIWFPWPDSMQRIREEQWEQALDTWAGLADLAIRAGVKRIALELLPLQLVYNVPTLARLRGEIGDVIGANIDPSHMFWQQMDPVRVLHALGPAVHHVHLKDTELYPDELALNGVLDSRPWDDPAHRSWIFRTVGEGHPAAFWASFIEALREIRYDDSLSIENEDPKLPGKAGVKRAAALIAPLLPAKNHDASAGGLPDRSPA